MRARAHAARRGGDLRSIATPPFCADFEYITDLNGTWFIVSIRGEYRIHPDEIPVELRDKPLPPSRFWGWKKTALAWLAGAVTTLLISLAMHQRTSTSSQSTSTPAFFCRYSDCPPFCSSSH